MNRRDAGGQASGQATRRQIGAQLEVLAGNSVRVRLQHEFDDARRRPYLFEQRLAGPPYAVHRAEQVERLDLLRGVLLVPARDGVAVYNALHEAGAGDRREELHAHALAVASADPDAVFPRLPDLERDAPVLGALGRQLLEGAHAEALTVHADDAVAGLEPALRARAVPLAPGPALVHAAHHDAAPSAVAKEHQARRGARRHAHGAHDELAGRLPVQGVVGVDLRLSGCEGAACDCRGVPRPGGPAGARDGLADVARAAEEHLAAAVGP
eukprot:CAMPEP_0175698760 /NCGR_PEP_ID=MMETSP0097-20121207/34134_1 /TAXON_ID=311494 /ORGANISM="Alexandrium monilatum, Strain CCMP3105" /LENGTH=268 /DNA_ID=CAMNT_0017005961 /DNA_START=115 /DNA_END=917 /DNA_ORIENTATION=+